MRNPSLIFSGMLDSIANVTFLFIFFAGYIATSLYTSHLFINMYIACTRCVLSNVLFNERSVTEEE